MVVGAPVVAVAWFVLLYGLLQPTHRGPTATFWNRGRAAVLPQLDSIARRLRLGYAAYELDDSEYAGRIDAPIEDVDTLLAAYGFERMPLSAWKTLPDGRTEAGSWARREHPLAERQLHVMLFQAGEEATDCYAHEEFNAFHPRYAAAHYHAVEYNPPAGCRQLRELLGEAIIKPPASASESTDQ